MQTEQPQPTNEAAGGASDVERIVRHYSPDSLMRINGRMAVCVGFLIEACKLTPEGQKALSKWDKYRGA